MMEIPVAPKQRYYSGKNAPKGIASRLRTESPARPPIDQRRLRPRYRGAARPELRQWQGGKSGYSPKRSQSSLTNRGWRSASDGWGSNAGPLSAVVATGRSRGQFPVKPSSYSLSEGAAKAGVGRTCDGSALRSRLSGSNSRSAQFRFASSMKRMLACPSP
jgi:hypothetical protein